MLQNMCRCTLKPPSNSKASSPTFFMNLVTVKFKTIFKIVQYIKSLQEIDPSFFGPSNSMSYISGEIMWNIIKNADCNFLKVRVVIAETKAAAPPRISYLSLATQQLPNYFVIKFKGLAYVVSYLNVRNMIQEVQNGEHSATLSQRLCCRTAYSYKCNVFVLQSQQRQREGLRRMYE